jgi:predicted extracellular nuclease
MIDDNSSAQNPNPITVGGVYNLQDVVLRGGSQVTNLVGPLSYQFSAWFIQPAKQADLIIQNLFTPQRPIPTPVATDTSDVRLVFSNLLNYFTTLTSEKKKIICNGAARNL